MGNGKKNIKLYLCKGSVVDVDFEDDIDMLPEDLVPSPKTFQLLDRPPELNVLAAELFLQELLEKSSTFSALQQRLKSSVWILPRVDLFRFSNQTNNHHGNIYID